MILSAGRVAAHHPRFHPGDPRRRRKRRYNSSQVVFDGVLALTTLLIGVRPAAAGICTGAPAADVRRGHGR